MPSACPLPPTAAHRWDAYQAFFDRYVLRGRRTPRRVPAVEVFTLERRLAAARDLAAGRGDADRVPPARGRRRCRRRRRRPTSRLTASPTTPPTRSRRRWAATAGSCARRSATAATLEQRPDVLTYTTPPLEHDLELTGPLTAVLYAATSAPDTDFTIALVDVFADGTANQIQDGIVRARFRDGMAAPALVEPGRGRPLRDRPVRDQLPRPPRATGCRWTSRRAASTATTATRTPAGRTGTRPADGRAPGDPPLRRRTRRTSCCPSCPPPPDRRGRPPSGLAVFTRTALLPHVATFSPTRALRPDDGVPYGLDAPSAEQPSAAVTGTATGSLGSRERYAGRQPKEATGSVPR